MKETIAAFNKFIFTRRTAKHPHGPSMDQEDEFINIQEVFANISSSESDTPGSVDQPIVGNDQDSVLSPPVNNSAGSSIDSAMQGLVSAVAGVNICDTTSLTGTGEVLSDTRQVSQEGQGTSIRG